MISKTEQIRGHNDALRQNFYEGTAEMTPGVAALGAAGAVTQQKFLLFPLPARDAHDARRKREIQQLGPRLRGTPSRWRDGDPVRRRADHSTM